MVEENSKKVICFDFDGVIAKYDGWKGVDIFDKPNWEVVEAMQMLKAADKPIYHMVTQSMRFGFASTVSEFLGSKQKIIITYKG